MGAFVSKCGTEHTKHEEACSELRAKIQSLEQEVKELSWTREREAQAYEKCAVISEEERKMERKKHCEEAARLSKRVEEEEERIRDLEGELAAARAATMRKTAEWQWMGSEYLMEQMVERARREVAVEKWKQLYLAIKTELDDLIQRTGQGGKLCWAAEEGTIEGLRRELKKKEEVIDALRSRIAIMEKEGIKQEREIDILRQSLRILSSTKRNRRRNPQRSLRCEFQLNGQHID